jgi:hypothetical protein
MQVYGNGLYEGMQEYDDLSRALRGDFFLENPDEKVDLTGNANVSIQNQVVDKTNALAKERFNVESICLEKPLTISVNQQKECKRKFDVLTPDIEDASHQEEPSNKASRQKSLTTFLQAELDVLVEKAKQEQCPTITSRKQLKFDQKVQLIKLVGKYGNRWEKFAIILHCEKPKILESLAEYLINTFEGREGLPFYKISCRYSKLIDMIENPDDGFTPALIRELDCLVEKAKQQHSSIVESTKNLTLDKMIQLIKLVERYGNRWVEFAIILHCESRLIPKNFIGNLIRSLQARECCMFNQMKDKYGKLIALARKKCG